MAEITEIVRYCDTLLESGRFRDYCPNGLQVEGWGEVLRIVSGVTASRALIEQAIAQEANMLLVHHGYFWKGEDARIVGMKRGRISMLLEHGINLVA
ncbi:MAG: Nif3-like dinuclear metal center hexameric protein, partial [Granulosicoccaceae bacterium]